MNIFTEAFWDKENHRSWDFPDIKTFREQHAGIFSCLHLTPAHAPGRHIRNSEDFSAQALSALEDLH